MAGNGSDINRLFGRNDLKVEGFDCDTRAPPLLISCRSVLVLAASNCGSADLQVFASAGAATRLSTSQIEKARIRGPLLIRIWD